MKRRQPESCECSCDCACTTNHESGICYLCRGGAHSPGVEIRRHLRASLEVWIRALAQTKTAWGNDKGPDKSNRAVEVWADWHRRQACPVNFEV